MNIVLEDGRLINSWEVAIDVISCKFPDENDFSHTLS